MRGYLKWIALLVLLAAAVWLLPTPGRTPRTGEKALTTAGPADGEEPENVVIEAVLSLPGDGWDGLAAKTAEIEAGADPADRVEAVLRKILEDPQSPLPEETLIRQVFVYDDVAVVSLDGAFREKFWGGPWRELLAVYSLVNTLTENLERIEKVRILIDDQEAEVFASHVDITEEISPDQSFTIEKEAAGA
ncbi:MAG: GerMN domain-containing protein [Candidatus Nitrospinota bacterium M3_3B_026]